MQIALNEAIATDGRATSTEPRQSVVRGLKGIAAISLQLLGLWTLNAVGIWIINKTALPIPGNLVGMVVLYGLLALGVIKLSWFEAAGSFLIRHLAFFFVPITVGLMNTEALFATHGIGIIVTLAVSAGIGLMLAGWVSQFLLRKPEQPGSTS
jgi:holin-like protein